MIKYSIAERYEEVLQSLKERTRYYSRHHWFTDSEHDPGLTTMQLLANSLALLEEEYCTLLDEYFAFNNNPYKPWQSVSGKQGMLHFKARFSPPMKQDFETLPAVVEDIRCMAEKIAGVKRAWVYKGELEDTALFLEFAEVMPKVKRNGSNEEEISYKQKESILHSVSSHLQKSQGLCQPVLPVQEALPFSLNIWVVVRCKFHEISGNNEQKKDIPAKIASVMTDIEDFLYLDSYPKIYFQPVDLQAYLDEVISVQCSTFIDGIEKKIHGYEQVTLSKNQHFFNVSQWRFSLEHNGHVRDATPDEMHMGKHLYSTINLHQVWTEQWFEPVKQITEPKISKQNDSTHLTNQARMDRIMIHQQFPACYKLDSKRGDATAQTLQMQGWLLLFEQLLANMTKPQNFTDRYFQFNPLKPIDFIGNIIHPMLSTLSAVEDYHKTLATMVAGEKHFLQLPTNMLQYLATLQGEETWIHYEDNKNQAKKSLNEDNLAFWLRGLAYYNGNRLSNNSKRGVGRFELGGSILEERLSMLLRPLTFLTPKLPQQYFNMRFYSNPITGKEEFRCYIMDNEENIRIICDIISTTPEEAENVALMALRFAKFAEHYSLHDKTIRIGLLAKLPELHSSEEASMKIKECEKWVKTILSPWVKVVSYEDLGEQLPYCVAVLMAEEDVPEKYRTTLTDEIRQHIPAHLYPNIIFLNQKDSKRVDLLLHKPENSAFTTVQDRFLELRKLLKKYEQTQEISESNE